MASQNAACSWTGRLLRRRPRSVSRTIAWSGSLRRASKISPGAISSGRCSSLLPDDLKLLILDHPTRGLDLGSEIWVWQQLHERCLHGTVILFTSTDLDELVDNSDRIIVFSGGKVSSPVVSAEVSREELGYMIGGVNL